MVSQEVPLSESRRRALRRIFRLREESLELGVVGIKRRPERKGDKIHDG